MSSNRRKKATSASRDIDWAKRKMNFSFEYYDAGHQEYCISNWQNETILKALRALKDISAKNHYELIHSPHVYHFHEVDWSVTVHKEGFTNTELNKLDPFQFALVGVNRQLARVFGGYYQGTFYIGWFDLNHDIHPVPLRNT